MSTSPQNVQAGPAMAMVQIITEFPELHPLDWSLSSDGMLMASAMNLDVDVRPLMAAYIARLGGRPTDTVSTPGTGDPKFTSWLYVVWRDVPLSITFRCPAVLVAGEVPSVGALLEQRHQVEDAAEPPAAFRDDALVSLPVAAWSARVSA